MTNPAAIDDELKTHFKFATDDIVDGLNASQHRRVDGSSLSCKIVIVNDLEPYALAAQRQESSVVVFSTALIHNCLAIAYLIEPVLSHLRSKKNEQRFERNDLVSKLIWGSSLNDGDKREYINLLPRYPGFKVQRIGAFAIFYDMLRLLIAHELFHIILGHASFSQRMLGLGPIAEKPQSRLKSFHETEGEATTDILKSFELHADEMAMKLNIGQILYGKDISGYMMDPHVDLVERLTIFNIACSIFTLFWRAEEQDLSIDSMSTTHPPAGLRYLNFRDYQREMAGVYDPNLLFAVDSLSLNALSLLSEIAGEFNGLLNLTPLLFRTPTMKKLARLSDHFMAVNVRMSENWKPLVYIPSREVP
ncbi:hypothetical protein ELH26_14395 [Rhizobium leguminosarum]|uniref:hypothetical protein n=1 Tax=Rhizobium leguminosarum TaxID=384 RepID=UPI0010CED8AD|nr:hypothetical protein [Rhizobium leguminosarum]TBC95136.1 hypothetical protein ELH26_14395 [Rhizobium leguminosarum]